MLNKGVQTNGFRKFLQQWFNFIKKEVKKDVIKVKSKIVVPVKETTLVMGNTKQTMFFDSKEYIGLTVNNGIITLIVKPPESFVEEARTAMKKRPPSEHLHGKDCDCSECLDTLIQQLASKFNNEESK